MMRRRLRRIMRRLGRLFIRRRELPSSPGRAMLQLGIRETGGRRRHNRKKGTA